MLTTILKKYKNSFYPILGEPLTAKNAVPLDLSIHNRGLMALDLTIEKQLEYFIFEHLNKNNVSFGYGGYGENRHLYGKSDNFHVEDSEARCIHLGIDLWGQVGTSIYAPLDGKVHSFQYNAPYLDYGATIILEHQLDNYTFFSLYGHLSLASLEGLSQGKPIAKGTLFAHFGDYPENGGWSPHLHFQLITDLLGKSGDFIGVASKAEAAYYMGICPNPAVLLGLE
jgi:peptidoglycan LD-endopeptidase LytH